MRLQYPVDASKYDPGKHVVWLWNTQTQAIELMLMIDRERAYVTSRDYSISGGLLASAAECVHDVVTACRDAEFVQLVERSLRIVTSLSRTMEDLDPETASFGSSTGN
jgi:hypothetical protein